MGINEDSGLVACSIPILGIIMPNMGILLPAHASLPIRFKRKAERISARTSLADALFTTTQQRVLALLFGQPHRSFFTSQLIELTGSGSGAVQRELQRLASSRLVNVTSVGTQKQYQANPNSPIYQELIGIVRKTIALVEPISPGTRTLCRPHYASHTLRFCSAGQGYG